MGKRIFLSLLICLICNVCCIYQVNADASSCTANTKKENCKCPGWGFSEKTGCTKCDLGKYNDGTTDDITQCKPCENKIPSVAEQTDFTTKNCPWKLTCSENTYFDNNENKCMPCNGGYESSEHTVEYNGGNTPNDSDACQPKSCIAGQYRSDKTQNCEPCPAGSTSAEGATSINECYMDKTTKFYTADGYQIPFETVFGDDVTISYDATDE